MNAVLTLVVAAAAVTPSPLALPGADGPVGFAGRRPPIDKFADRLRVVHGRNERLADVRLDAIVTCLPPQERQHGGRVEDRAIHPVLARLPPVGRR